jgi:hypothetical protein
MSCIIVYNNINRNKKLGGEERWKHEQRDCANHRLHLGDHHL